MGEKLDFRDFDLLAVGPVVPEAEEGFDHYWNSEWAYPIDTLRKPRSRRSSQQARARFDAQLAEDLRRFPYPLPRGAERGARAGSQRSRDRAVWAPAEVVYDDPAAGGRCARRGPGRRRAAVRGARERGPARGRRSRTPTWCRIDELAPDPSLRGARRDAALAHQLAGDDRRGRGKRRLREDAPAAGQARRRALRDAAGRGVARAVPRPSRGARRSWRCTARRRCSIARWCSSDRSTSIRARERSIPRRCSWCHSPTMAEQMLQAFATDFAPPTPGASAGRRRAQGGLDHRAARAHRRRAARSGERLAPVRARARARSCPFGPISDALRPRADGSPARGVYDGAMVGSRHWRTMLVALLLVAATGCPMSRTSGPT